MGQSNAEYHNKYYYAHKEAHRAKQNKYRKKLGHIFKVARHLQISIPEARKLVEDANRKQSNNSI